MLVVISDIHFVDGTAGEHNLPYSAFESVFLSDIASLAKDKGAKEIKLLLLGDIIDLIRSTRWLETATADRPWGNNGLKDIPKPQNGSITEKICLRILGQVSDSDLKKSNRPNFTLLPSDTILSKNWETFKLFREFGEVLKNKFQIEIPVKIIYVPGNHDRLCNLYPSVRDEIKKLLGITIMSNTVEGYPTDEWWYKSDFKDEEYGVYARHGHEFDPWNYGGNNDFARSGHTKISIGDILTTEFAAKIPWMFAKFKANGKYPQISDELINRLKDIDNIRPINRILEWLYYKVRKNDYGKTREAIEVILNTVFEELLDNEFVQQWRSPGTSWDEVIHIATRPWARWISKGILEKIEKEGLLSLLLGEAEGSDSSKEDPYARAAYNERLWKEDNRISFILYGHTHIPLQQPLDSAGDREIIYINTGTWRNRIFRTISLDKAYDFIDLKHMTYSIFYSKDEDTKDKIKDSLSFDVWTGSKKKYYL